MHTDVADQNRVFRKRAVDLVRSALRIDRRGIVRESRRNEPVPLLAIAVDGLEPFLACIGALVEIAASIELREHLPQEGAHIRHQTERNRIIAADLLRIDVDVDQPCGRNSEGVAGNP